MLTTIHHYKRMAYAIDILKQHSIHCATSCLSNIKHILGYSMDAFGSTKKEMRVYFNFVCEQLYMTPFSLILGVWALHHSVNGVHLRIVKLPKCFRMFILVCQKFVCVCVCLKPQLLLHLLTDLDETWHKARWWCLVVPKGRISGPLILKSYGPWHLFFFTTCLHKYGLYV
jgi:hypothetical protein